jgi:hypothetical protein
MRRVTRAWAVLTWRHWAWATALGILGTITIAISHFDVHAHWLPQAVLLRSPWFVLCAYLFLLGIAWVDSASGDSAPSLWRYACAALGVAVICVSLAASLALYIPWPPRNVEEGAVIAPPKDIPREVRRRLVIATGPGRDAAVFGFLATIIYARLRNARRLALNLSQAELGRSEASRALLAARLAAARAVIDPREVIERLDAIARMYEEDMFAADRQLDDLIALLRDAIPRVREENAPSLPTGGKIAS